MNDLKRKLKYTVKDQFHTHTKLIDLGYRLSPKKKKKK